MLINIMTEASALREGDKNMQLKLERWAWDDRIQMQKLTDEKMDADGSRESRKKGGDGESE